MEIYFSLHFFFKKKEKQRTSNAVHKLKTLFPVKIYCLYLQGLNRTNVQNNTNQQIK